MSVIAETIDILIEKSPTPLEEIWIDDLVIGIFFSRGEALHQVMPEWPSRPLGRFRKRSAALPRLPESVSIVIKRSHPGL